MNFISSCCHAPIQEGFKQEFPLGGGIYYINYKINICEKCKAETEPLPSCEVCGSIIDWSSMKCTDCENIYVEVSK